MNAKKAMEFKVLVDVERLRQCRLWGDNDVDGGSMNVDRYISILGEEFGEVCNAVNECEHARTDEDFEKWAVNLKEELVQVAAVCQKIYEALP